MTTDVDSRMNVDDRVDSRKKGRREERGRSGDRERSSKDRERDDPASKDDARERRKEDRSEFVKDGDREKERSGRDKARDKEKDHDRERHREKERDSERGKDRGRDRDEERGKDRDRGKDKDREYERRKEREKVHDHAGDRDKERERERDRGHDRSKVRERDHEKELERDPERDRGKEKDREKGKDREREKERDRERGKDRETEKERSKDREKEKVRERNRGRDKVEREMDKSKTRDKERETYKSMEGEKDGKVKFAGESRRVSKDEEVQDLDANHEQISSKDHTESQQPPQSTSELKDRLLNIKEERLKKKFDGSSEILSWVGKTRKLERRNTEKEKAERISKALEEQDNILAESDDEDEEASGHGDLAGVKILHGLDKVVEGGAVILTLKDQNILANGDINDDVDMLENVEIGEQKHRDEAYRAAKKKTGIYDDKFNDDMSSLKTMLPQYDDPVEDEGVILDEDGRFTGEAEKKLDELRRRIEGTSTSKNFEDLTLPGKTSSDYYTPDEMVQFKKPKKKKFMRKREKLDLDALEAEAISAGLGVGDLGSRNDSNRKSAREEQERTEAEMRSNAYQSAYAKAEEASKALRQEQTITVRATEDDGLVFGEDYEDLQSSLEQAIKLTLKRRDEHATSGPQAVALLTAASKEEGDKQVFSVEDPQEDKVVITEMEEFVLGLQLNEEAHKPESESVFMDEEDVGKPFVQETKSEIHGWTEVEESIKDEPTNEDKKDVTPDEIIHEVPIGKGLAGAFKLLQERGTLNEGIDWGGRNMDKKKSKLAGIYDDSEASASKKKGEATDSSKRKYDEINGPKKRSDETNSSKRRSDDANALKKKNDGTNVLRKKFDETKEIRIERTDEFGRIMTPKEAFRVLSHKFHGKGPGKMKQEKRMKQYQEDLKTKQMKASDTPSQTMERMREAQARLKTPYLVLSGHVKPGQTSDPRSGFATVGKDHLGSLTPMLGNRKVEHFLGIRKPDSGSASSPPAKKSKT